MLDVRMLKTYFGYVVPSTLAFVLTGVYSIVDGFFVGHMAGDVALAGINVAWPIVALVMALGTGIGMGGAVVSSIRAGEGNDGASRRAIGCAITLLVAVTPVVMAVLLLGGQPLLWVIGGREEVLAQAQAYLSVIAWGSVFQMVEGGCVPLVRNMGHVKFAMVAQVVGGLVNVLGDWLLVMVLGWGIVGAAVATVSAQAIASVFFVVFFLRGGRISRADLGVDRSIVGRMFKIGFAPAALTLLPEVTTVVMNIATVTYGGVTAQASFAIMSYTVVAVQWIIQGVHDGSQPIISLCYGSGDARSVRRLRHINYVLAVLMAVLGWVGLYFSRWHIAALFGTSPEGAAVFAHGVTLFALCLPFYAISHVVVSFFYAVEHARGSLALIVGEVALMIVFPIVLPLFWGLDGAWMSAPFCYAILSVMALCLMHAGRGALSERLLRQKRLHDEKENEVV
ncbi:MAG: polysaccharide biosynthesis C-terminal domain-containing protein [Eggerthellaceae bacterium]|nr:polysaccharide biosynthesis C-terminal domain-containing protein [Eggerthellaceae bacterium]